MTNLGLLQVAVLETDTARLALGLQLAENGAGLIFIRGCPDGNVHRQLKYVSYPRQLDAFGARGGGAGSAPARARTQSTSSSPALAQGAG